MRPELAVALSLSVTACGNEISANAAADPDAGSDTGGSTSVGPPEPALDAGADDDPACRGSGYEEQVEPGVLRTYRGMVVDQNGDPAALIPAQACGLDVCIFGETDADGRVELTVDDVAITKPRFKYGKGKQFTMFAYPMPEGATVDVGTQLTWMLPDVSTAVPLVAGAEVTHGGATLAIPAGGRVRIDLLTFETAEEQGFRADRIPLDRAPKAVDPALGFELLYTLNPIDSMFCPPATLTLPNGPGWDPGTEVEVFLHGTRIQEEWAPYGGWAKVSDAIVTADGSSVVTVEGSGLPILGVIGLRRRGGQ